MTMYKASTVLRSNPTESVQFYLSIDSEENLWNHASSMIPINYELKQLFELNPSDEIVDNVLYNVEYQLAPESTSTDIVQIVSTYPFNITDALTVLPDSSIIVQVTKAFEDDAKAEAEAKAEEPEVAPVTKSEPAAEVKTEAEAKVAESPVSIFTQEAVANLNAAVHTLGTPLTVRLVYRALGTSDMHDSTVTVSTPEDIQHKAESIAKAYPTGIEIIDMQGIESVKTAETNIKAIDSAFVASDKPTVVPTTSDVSTTSLSSEPALEPKESTTKVPDDSTVQQCHETKENCKNKLIAECHEALAVMLPMLTNPPMLSAKGCFKGNTSIKPGAVLEYDSALYPKEPEFIDYTEKVKTVLEVLKYLEAIGGHNA